MKKNDIKIKEQMKKTLAATMALSMSMSLMTVPALAAEGDAATDSVITIPSAPGDGSAAAPAVTVDVTIQEDGTTTTTTTQTSWEGETKVPSETGEGANDGTTTTVTGSQTATETKTVDDQDRVTKETGHVEGSETTKTETVETDVTKDVIIYDNTEDINESTDPVTTPESPETVWETNEDGTEKWVEGEETWETNEDGTEKWTDAGTTTVTDATTDADGWKTVEPSYQPSQGESDVIQFTDPLGVIDDGKEVKLELTPNGNDKEQRGTIREVLMNSDEWNNFDFAIVEKLEENGGEHEDGNTTYTALYNNGIIIGYTAVTTTDYDPVTGNPVLKDGVAETVKDTDVVKTAPEYPKDATANDYTKTDDDGNVIEGIQTQVEEIKEGDKVIGYRITKTTTTPNSGTVPSKATGATETEPSPTETKFDLPAKPTESETTENGVTTKVVVENVYDKNGEHVGYKSTTVRTDSLSGNELYRATETIYGTTTTINKSTVTDPTRQEVITDTTTVTTEVTEIYGYTQVKDVELEKERTTDTVYKKDTTTSNYQLIQTKDGTYYYVFTAEMMGVNENKTEVEGQKVHGTTQQNLQMMPDESLYNNGNTWQTSSNDLQGPGDGSDNYSGYTRYDSTSELTRAVRDAMSTMEGTQLVLAGYGAFSEYEITDDQGNPHTTRQYKMLSDEVDANGNPIYYYGYCVELGKGLEWGGVYDQVKNNVTNIIDPDGGIYRALDIGNLASDHTYFEHDEFTVNRISSVANNGYWGQTSGIGSLDAVKDMLNRVANEMEADAATATDPVKKAELEAKAEACREASATLTDGQALAATQAAIWKYGNHGDVTFTDINKVTEYYYDYGNNGTNNSNYTKVYNEDGTIAYYDGGERWGEQVSDSADTDGRTAYNNIQAVYEALTWVADNQTAAPVVDTIDAEDLLGATIILDSKTGATKDFTTTTTDAEGNEVSTTTTHDVYNTDLSFTLAVSTSSINGDMIVQVMQGGQVVETRRLAGTNTGADDKTIYPDANGTYTITNVELAEGVNITLNLEGTQHLADGVYVYQCNNSQNFVGLTTKTHDVNLSVDMRFEVQEPTAEYKMQEDTSTVTKEKTERLTELLKGSRQDTLFGTTEQTTTSSVTTGTETTIVYADVTVTETTITETGREWTEDWEKEYSYNDTIPETPEQNTPDKPEIIIPDEDVPTTDIPEEDIPTTDIPEEEIPVVDIPDDEIALDDVPKTGDVSLLAMGLTALLSGSGLAGLLGLGRKGRKDA